MMLCAFCNPLVAVGCRAAVVLRHSVFCPGYPASSMCRRGRVLGFQGARRTRPKAMLTPASDYALPWARRSEDQKRSPRARGRCPTG
eukprot:3710002-Rhodomonas_salina.1